MLVFDRIHLDKSTSTTISTVHFFLRETDLGQHEKQETKFQSRSLSAIRSLDISPILRSLNVLPEFLVSSSSFSVRKRGLFFDNP